MCLDSVVSPCASLGTNSLVAVEASIVPERQRLHRHRSSCSPFMYWLVVKPFVATWLTVIPYGFLNLAYELGFLTSFPIEIASVLSWLGIMVLWPDPKEMRSAALRPLLQRRLLYLLALESRPAQELVPAQEFPRLDNQPLTRHTQVPLLLPVEVSEAA